MNGDGLDDLIVGDRDGFVYLFTRQSDGSLARGVKIKSAGTVIDILNNSAPEVSDLNGDGLPDLLVGTQSTGNYLYMYYNTGTKTEPQFGSFNFLLNKGMFVSIGNAAPELFDLDGDGVKDLVSGNSMGEILYYHNSGTNTAHSYDEPQSLSAGGKEMKVDKYSQFCFTDWNNDGVTDMVVGDKNENVMLFLGKGGVSTIVQNSQPENVKLTTSGRELQFSEPVTFCVLYSTRGERLVKYSGKKMQSVQLPHSLSTGLYILHGETLTGSFQKRIVLQ